VSALLLSAGAQAQQQKQSDALPEGRWTGTITSKTVPDHDKDGEWATDIALSHCAGRILLQFKNEDGTYTPGFTLEQIKYRRMFILVFAATEGPDFTGWVESQVWTLVDARPNGWTIGQSRAVLNQEMKPTEPWYTFRRFAWGTLEHDPQWCERTPPVTQ
jgi:hypothetical protein